MPNSRLVAKSNKAMRLVLASKSPRRRQLLSEMGFPVEVVSLDVDEHLDTPINPRHAAEILACRKAEAFPEQQLEQDDVLVTADTVVIADNDILGKPANHEEASAMLHRLSGREHHVCTGVCLRSKEKRFSFTEETTVHFLPLTDQVIEYYINHYRPYDKAGAYGIQEWIGMVGISHIEGCFYNVMGLPVARLYRELTNRFLSK